MANVLRALREDLLRATNRKVTEELELIEGGTGSGHFGHKGRPGLVGGSVGRRRGGGGAKEVRAAKYAGETIKRFHSPEKAEMITRLSTSPVISAKRLGGGANVSKVIILEDNTVAVFKPKDGEEMGLRPNIDAGTYFQREAAAYEIAELVGMDDLIPPTTIREVDNEIGSVQKFVENATVSKSAVHTYGTNDHDLHRAAAFDFIVGNTDRHHANWLITDDEGKIQLIDHGLSFPSTNDFLRSGLVTRVRDESIPSTVKQAWKGKWKGIASRLRVARIDNEAIEMTRIRYKAYMRGKTLDRAESLARLRFI